MKNNYHIDFCANNHTISDHNLISNKSFDEFKTLLSINNQFITHDSNMALIDSNVIDWESSKLLQVLSEVNNYFKLYDHQFTKEDELKNNGPIDLELSFEINEIWNMKGNRWKKFTRTWWKGILIGKDMTSLKKDNELYDLYKIRSKDNGNAFTLSNYNLRKLDFRFYQDDDFWTNCHFSVLIQAGRAD